MLVIVLWLISFLLGSCWLFISFAVDLTNDLNALNIGRRSKRNSMQAKEHLRNIVKAFSNVHELSRFDFSKSRLGRADDSFFGRLLD